jgi:hypothetical protein
MGEHRMQHEQSFQPDGQRRLTSEHDELTTTTTPKCHSPAWFAAAQPATVPGRKKSFEACDMKPVRLKELPIGSRRRWRGAASDACHKEPSPRSAAPVPVEHCASAPRPAVSGSVSDERQLTRQSAPANSFHDSVNFSCQIRIGRLACTQLKYRPHGRYLKQRPRPGPRGTPLSSGRLSLPSVSSQPPCICIRVLAGGGSEHNLAQSRTTRGDVLLCAPAGGERKAAARKQGTAEYRPPPGPPSTPCGRDECCLRLTPTSSPERRRAPVPF